MATENEELVLSISADTRQILNAMKRLTGEIARSTSGIQKQFDDLGKGVDRSMTTAMQKRIDTMVGVGTNATKEWTGALAEQGKEMERLRARFSPVFSTVTRYRTTLGEIRAAHRLGAISADEMAAAIQRERQATLASIAAIKQRNGVLADTRGPNNFNTANIAAQFQDIGVTTAMGMSPLQIGLQQGTQLSAVLNQMGSGKQVIQGLGAAFMSIVNPISLVTIGTIAATAAATQYFLTSEDGADATSQRLEQQAELIQRVAQKWGEALPAVKAYVDEQARLAGEADKTQATNLLISRAYEQVAAVLPRVNSELSKFTQEASGGGWGAAAEEQATRLSSAYDEIERSFSAYSTAVDEGRDTTSEYAALQRALTEFTTNSAVPATGALRDVVTETADAYAKAAAEAGNLANQAALAARIGPRMGAGKSDRAPGSVSTLREDEFARRFGYDQYFNFPSTPKERSSARAGGKSPEETEAERKKKAIDDVIASLKFEAEQLGRTGTEQRIYNELKRAGVDLNSENGRQIANLVTSLESERQALEANKQALEARGKAIENLFDMGADAIGSIIDKSVSAEDAVRKLAVQLALAAAQAALFGSGPLAGLFGGGGGIFGKAIPKYGNGTNNHPGGLAIVGDKGPELLNLPRGSQVIPNVRPVAVPSAPAILGASGGGSISAPVQVTIDARGADREGLSRVEQQVARLRAELPSTVVATVRQAQKTRQLR